MHESVLDGKLQGRQVLIRKTEVDALLERNTLNSARATDPKQRNNKLNY